MTGQQFTIAILQSRIFRAAAASAEQDVWRQISDVIDAFRTEYELKDIYTLQKLVLVEGRECIGVWWRPRWFPEWSGVAVIDPKQSRGPA